MQQIFVSSAAADSDFADILVDTLTKGEFSACAGQGLDAAGQWSSDVDGRIREALAVVAILSPASIRTPRVNYEWAFALGCGLPVLPVLLKAAEADLHPRLRTIQHLDFTNHLNRPWNSLMNALGKLRDDQRVITLRVPRHAPPVIQRAALALDSTEENERAAALASLGEMDHPAAVELLAGAVRHPIDQVRFGAAMQLAEHRDRRALPALLEGIRSNFEEIEPWMLARIGAPAVPALIDALRDESAAVQGYATRALGMIGGPEAVAVLAERLRDPDPLARRRAGFALEDAADPIAIPALIIASHDPEQDVRRAAVGALVKCAAKTGSWEDLAPLFIEALQDEYDQVGINACEGLKQSHDPRAIPALLQSGLHNQVEQTGAFCRKAIRELGADAAPALRAAAQERNPATLSRIIDMLRDLHDESDLPFLIDATRHMDAEVRKSAVAYLRAKQAVPALIERLKDEDEITRRLAVENLGAIGDPAAIPPLIDCLADEDIAGNVARVLENFGTKQARLALRAWRKQNKN